MKIKWLDIAMIAFAIYAGKNIDVLSYIVWAGCVLYAICRVLEIKEKNN